MVSGAILPLVALGFIKSLVDYIKPDEGVNEGVNEGVKAVVQDQITDAVTSNNPIETYNQEPPYQPTNEDIKKFEELLRKYDEKFQNNTVDELVETPKIEEKTIETAELIEDVITDESTDPIIEDVIIEEENIEPEIVVNEEIIVEEENIEEDVINTYEEIIVEEENIEPEIAVNEEIIVEEENIEPEIAVNEQFIIGVEIVNDNEEVIEKKN
jgi:NDP-sugar pyrophosphorylase family protein